MAKALAEEGFAEKVTRQAVKKVAWARNPGQLSVEPASSLAGLSCLGHN